MRAAVHDYLDFRLDLGDPDTVAAYDELPLWSALAGQLLLHHVPLKRHVRVLDAGCGTGFPLLELAERLGSTSTVHGVDTWGEALDRARFKARVRRIGNVEFVRSDVASLPFPDSHFDLIVSNLGINNFAEPERAVRECRRVIRPDGRFALATNLKGHMAEFYDAFEATLADTGDGEALEALEKHIAHRATPEKLAALFAGAGFRLTRVETASVSMRFADGSALLRHYFIKLGFLDGWKSVVREDRRAEVIARLEERLNARSSLGAGLQLTIPLAYVEAAPEL
ncbi:MAG TPA: methyltransferase domain-containing protein [Thermoanaerobaculia bacterium]|nr:methyltransferase domain-containing protein [Thermoanaerobaculia bacterium]